VKGNALSSHPASISGATIADLADVLALLQRCSLLETGVREAIADFWVARSGGQLLGCAGLETYGDRGLLRSVAVEAAARGSGLGSRLVERTAAMAREKGVRELFLLTTTAPRFFTRCGFEAIPRDAVPQAVAESWEFREGCPQTALPMRRLLEARCD
jgi:amino-acid N-acetyltransferase